VSTEEGSGKRSRLADQRRDISQEAARKGWTNVAFVADEG
jgi:hypothetical protein